MKISTQVTERQVQQGEERCVLLLTAHTPHPLKSKQVSSRCILRDNIYWTGDNFTLELLEDKLQGQRRDHPIKLS